MKYNSWLLLLAGQALAWNHASESELREALRQNAHTLVTSVIVTLETPHILSARVTDRANRDACKALEPEWKIALEKEPKKNVLSVDCEKSALLCTELDAVSFPAIRLYHQDGSVDRFRGPRKAAAISSFVRRSLRPVVSQVDAKNVTSFLQIDDVVFIAHFLPQHSNLLSRYTSLAEQYRDRFSFAASTDVGQSSVLICYNNLDNIQRQVVELSSVQALEDFIKVCSTPLVPQLTRSNEMEYTQSGKSIMHYVFADEKDRERYEKEVLPLAKKYEEYVHFTTTDPVEYPEMLPILGFKMGEKKVLSLQNPNTMDIFPYKGGKKITAAVVETFLIDITEGKVPPLGRSGGGMRHEEL